jgi:hypothetical protein
VPCCAHRRPQASTIANWPEDTKPQMLPAVARSPPSASSPNLCRWAAAARVQPPRGANCRAKAASPKRALIPPVPQLMSPEEAVLGCTRRLLTAIQDNDYSTYKVGAMGVAAAEGSALTLVMHAHVHACASTVACMPRCHHCNRCMRENRPSLHRPAPHRTSAARPSICTLALTSCQAHMPFPRVASAGEGGGGGEGTAPSLHRTPPHPTHAAGAVRRGHVVL